MLFKSSLFLATALAFAVSGASAGITSIATETVGTLNIRTQPQVGPIVNGPSSDYRSDPGGRGAGYAAFSDVDSALIYFEAGSMSAGRDNGSKSITEVSFDVSVDNPGDSINRVESLVFESTFGFFVSDFSEFVDQNQLVEGCTGVTLATCARTETGDGFSKFGRFGAVDNLGEVAKTSFAFEILSDGVALRTIGGSISMVRHADGSISFVEDLGAGADALSAALVNFGDDHVANYAQVYKWDRTPFEAIFADPLEFGDPARRITYRITTETSSNAVAIGLPSTSNMVVGFACFADPRGVGDQKKSVFSAFASAFNGPIGNAADATCDDFILTGDEDEPRVYTLAVPEIRDGAIVLAAVPEPATWAMLIAGFGLTGFAARRRRALAA